MSSKSKKSSSISSSKSNSLSSDSELPSSISKSNTISSRYSNKLTQIKENKSKSSHLSSKQKNKLSVSSIGSSNEKSSSVFTSKSASNDKSSYKSIQSNKSLSALTESDSKKSSTKSSFNHSSTNASSKSSTATAASSCHNNDNQTSSIGLSSSIKPSSIPGRPKLCEKIDKIQHCEPFIVINEENDLHSFGYKLKNFIVSDDCYEYYSAEKDSKEIICKIIYLNKCTPRYRENMMKNSLKIARFMCSGGGQSSSISEYFIQILEIFKLDSRIHMFMVNCPNKSMYLMLLDKDEYSPEDERRWTIQIVKAIIKMQEYGIAHRFLKLQHILFDNHQNVKIAGWSKAILYWDPNNDCPLLQNCERKSRKNCHLPPETFRHIYDPSKIDIWSLGVLMVCLQTRSYPFNVNSSSKFSSQWRQFVLKHKMNRFVRAACNQTFFIDPKRRVKAIDFLKHPYFNTSITNIIPKVFKTTIDPKYDPDMPIELSCHVSTTAVNSYNKDDNSSVITGSKRSNTAGHSKESENSSIQKSSTCLSTVPPSSTMEQKTNSKRSVSINDSQSSTKDSKTSTMEQKTNSKRSVSLHDSKLSTKDTKSSTSSSTVPPSSTMAEKTNSKRSVSLSDSKSSSVISGVTTSSTVRTNSIKSSNIKSTDKQSTAKITSSNKSSSSTSTSSVSNIKSMDKQSSSILPPSLPVALSSPISIKFSSFETLIEHVVFDSDDDLFDAVIFDVDCLSIDFIFDTDDVDVDDDDLFDDVIFAVDCLSVDFIFDDFIEFVRTVDDVVTPDITDDELSAEEKSYESFAQESLAPEEQIDKAQSISYKKK